MDFGEHGKSHSSPVSSLQSIHETFIIFFIFSFRSFDSEIPKYWKSFAIGIKGTFRKLPSRRQFIESIPQAMQYPDLSPIPTRNGQRRRSD